MNSYLGNLSSIVQPYKAAASSLSSMSYKATDRNMHSSTSVMNGYFSSYASGNTSIAYSPQGNHGVARDVHQMDLERRMGTSNSVVAAKAEVAKTPFPQNAKSEIYRLIDESQRVGEVYLNFVNSERSRELKQYLTHKGAFSEGIENIVITPGGKIDESHQFIAATIPKSSRIYVPGTIFYNPTEAVRWKKITREKFRSLDDYLIDEDVIAHEMVHTYLHDHADMDKTRHEIEVEEAMAIVSSVKARNSRNALAKKQYQELASMHIERYLTQKEKYAQEKGTEFDESSAMQELYDKYVSYVNETEGKEEGSGNEGVAVGETKEAAQQASEGNHSE